MGLPSSRPYQVPEQARNQANLAGTILTLQTLEETQTHGIACTL